MTVHWWMHWFWITSVVAALLLVPLATAHPQAGSTSPPSSAGGRSAHGWGSWPPPYEDEEDDEDGFLGPRALPLEGRPPEDPPEEPVPQDPDVDAEILAEYAREVAGNASRVLATREVESGNSTAAAAAASSQSNGSDSGGNYSISAPGARESKSFNPSVAPASAAPVKPAAGQNAVEGDGKASLAPSPAPTDASDAPQPDGLAPSAEASSPEPAEAEVDATAPAEAEAVSVSEAGTDASSAAPEEESGWTAYDASAAADDDSDVAGQQEESAAVELRSRTAEREAADEQEPAGRAALEAPVSRGRVAPAAPPAAMDAAAITGIALGIVVFSSLVGAVSFVMYRRRYLNKPQTLNDKCSNPDSSGYIDDSTLRENSEEMYSLDNDSFLNSLEAMTIQNYWTDNVKHTKL